ncbi:uncharacterized protein PG986_015156 [Apiospora aurea]|uniref:DUF7719 domain-containing protein n=1 Tax=Apiospora aurea TaxID=335848 RepID=A0ABR1PRQ6_9PEZI
MQCDELKRGTPVMEYGGDLDGSGSLLRRKLCCVSLELSVCVPVSLTKVNSDDTHYPVPTTDTHLEAYTRILPETWSKVAKIGKPQRRSPPPASSSPTPTNRARRRRPSSTGRRKGSSSTKPTRGSAPSGGKKGAKGPAAAEPVYVGKGEAPPPAAAVLTTTADRVLEALLWSVSLCTLHFTLDVLVQQQYAVELEWHTIIIRTLRALLVFTPLFYILHPHPSSPTLVPVVPKRYQEPIRQTIFFAVSVAAGCHLIKITNTYGYISVMKRSPPLGCLWVWSVIELNLLPATASVVIALAYLWLGFR